MRDFLLGGILLLLMLTALRRPWIGILGWTWISIMNPHSFSWRLSSLPVAAGMAGTTLLGLLFSSDRKEFFLSRESVVLMLFMLWMCIVLPFSVDMEDAYPLFERIMKIDFMILVAMVLLNSKRHIMWLAWMLAFSLGFYGVKGGLFTVATGGSFRVWGPTGTYIEGNNEVALALVIIIPLIRFVQTQVTNRWGRWALTGSMVLCAIAALGSHSRGALLALVGMALLMWWRGKNRFTGGIAMVVLAAVVLSLMPPDWWNRMETIDAYQQDDSALGRINAWWMAYNLACHHFFGGGFMVSTAAMFNLYAPNPADIHAAHSIYFMILGEQGFIGLFLFLLLWFVVWLGAGKLRKEGVKKPETQWLAELGSMCQVSLAGYAVGGAFLSLAYYDLPYNLLVLVVLGRRWLDGKAWLTEKVEPMLTMWPFAKKSQAGKPGKVAL